jgi:hypothetical protein
MARARRFAVRENVIRGTRAGILTSGRGAAQGTDVTANDVSDVTGEPAGAFGVLVRLGETVTVAGNTLANIGTEMTSAGLCAGIAVIGAGEVRVSANQLAGIGPEAETLASLAGVMVAGTFEHALVTENVARSTTRQRDRTRWHAVVIQSAGPELMRFAPSHPVFVAREGMLIPTGGFAALAPSRRDRATVSSNALTGGGELATCHVAVNADVVANANTCEHEGDPPAMYLRGSAITASTNRIIGGDSALLLDVDPARYAVVGNLAPIGVHLGSIGNPVPGPWNALNPKVP